MDRKRSARKGMLPNTALSNRAAWQGAEKGYCALTQTRAFRTLRKMAAFLYFSPSGRD